MDQDCDGGELCPVDEDGDGYAVDAVTVASDDLDCADPGEAAADAPAGDCDDDDARHHPGAPEKECTDPADYNCDGSSGYADGDGDGHAACADCDDSSASVHAGATEEVGDGVDQDCDGAELCYVDGDDDGYTADAPRTVASPDLDCGSAGEADVAVPAGDCDDADPAYNPGAPEEDCADPNDYNCDGSTGYADADADGFAACEECDDALAAVNPEADERCNGQDDDCDGTVDDDAVDAATWAADADGDGYTDASDLQTACDPPPGYAAATEADCADEDPDRNPGAPEIAGDGIDQDCDGADAEKDAPACGCGASDGSAGGALLALLLLVRRRLR